MFFGQNSEFLNLLMMKTVGNNGHLGEATSTNVNHFVQRIGDNRQEKENQMFSDSKIGDRLKNIRLGGCKAVLFLTRL